MNIDFTVFFDILNVDDFFSKIFFDLDKSMYDYKIVEEFQMNMVFPKVNILKYQGYTYMQKDSFILYMNNCIDGWINRIRITALKNNLRAAHIVIDDDKPYPGYMLEYYDKGEERTIYSIKDGTRWSFYAEGKQQFFEKNNQYNEIGATRKFNHKRILEYCENLGLNLNDESFFIPVSRIYNDYRISNSNNE